MAYKGQVKDLYTKEQLDYLMALYLETAQKTSNLNLPELETRGQQLVEALLEADWLDLANDFIPRPEVHGIQRAQRTLKWDTPSYLYGPSFAPFIRGLIQGLPVEDAIALVEPF